MKILVLFGHPAFQKSHVNKTLVHGIENIPEVTFHDLYEAYPEMDIDIDAEQKLLLEHDCIIFQYPFYWYSSPAIFKEWQDLVLEHGWAYGSKGKALEGKYFFCAITTGAMREAYGPEGNHGHPMRDYLMPLHQMALSCRMTPLPPFVIHGSLTRSDESCVMVRQEYHQLLHLLSNDELDLAAIQNSDYMNDYLIKRK